MDKAKKKEELKNVYNLNNQFKFDESNHWCSAGKSGI